MVPLRRPRRVAAGPLYEDQGPLEGHHHFRRGEYFVARGGGCLTATAVLAAASWPTPREMGRNAVAFVELKPNANVTELISSNTASIPLARFKVPSRSSSASSRRRRRGRSRSSCSASARGQPRRSILDTLAPPWLRRGPDRPRQPPRRARASKQLSKWIAAILVTLTAGWAVGPAQDIKIALIHGKTGPLEAYAKQTETGLRMGLEYATKGTMTVDGRKIVIITRTTRASPTSPRRRSPKPIGTTRSTSRSAPRRRPRRSRCCRSPRSTRRS